jgi:cytoskeleton protein RodZ
MNAQFVAQDRSSDELETPGRRLRSAREARGLEIERVAQMLHLKPAALSAIEADDYSALPGPVFARGYIRNYARLLDLDEEPLLRRLSSGRPSDPARLPRVPAPAKREIHSSHLLVRLVSWLIALSVAGLLFLWWQSPTDLSGLLAIRLPGMPAGSKSNAPAPSAEGKVSIPLPPTTAPSTPKVEPTAADAKPSARPPPTASTKPAEPSVAATPPGEAPPAPAAQISAQTPPATSPDSAPAETTSGKGVVLEFNDTSWVDIRDSTRNFKLMGDMRKGERRELGGTPPYSLVIGNAKSVRMSINGKPFDLASRSRGNVARFTLKPENLE